MKMPVYARYTYNVTVFRVINLREVVYRKSPGGNFNNFQREKRFFVDIAAHFLFVKRPRHGYGWLNPLFDG
jgi:hypothetical protein